MNIRAGFSVHNEDASSTRYYAQVANLAHTRKAIADAAAEGKFKVILNTNMSKETMNTLLAEGYTVPANYYLSWD